MLAAERIAKILEIINENGAVKVETLADLLGVSRMTVRRDLAKCEKSGMIQRCYGGAVLKSSIEKEADYFDKRQSHQDEKKKIAACAFGLIREKDAVFLDAGTTTYEIARLIQEKKLRLTVITNDLEIALLLTKSDVNLIILGGTVQKSTKSITDQIAEQNMKNLRMDLAFFGARSIDASFNVMTPTIEKAYLKRTAAQNSNKKYLVVDSSKFYKQALVRVDGLGDYTGVITDKVFSQEEMKQIREKSIHVIPVR